MMDDRIYSVYEGVPMNLSNREVECPKCRYKVITNEPAVKCKFCKSSLITLIIPIIKNK